MWGGVSVVYKEKQFKRNLLDDDQFLFFSTGSHLHKYVIFCSDVGRQSIALKLSSQLRLELIKIERI